MGNDVGDLDQFQPDPNANIFKADEVKNRPENIASQSGYTSSSIQRSRAEALVLSFAAGLPVLQPPPKTQVKNIYETSYSVGSAADAGGVAIPVFGYTKMADRIESTKESHPQTKSVLDMNDVLDFVKNLLSLVTTEAEETNPDRSSGIQSLRLMLSAMALEILYLSVYGGMTGDEFKSLFKDTIEWPENVKPVANQFIAFIKSHLPSDPKASNEAMSKLIESIDSHQSLTSLFQTTRVLSKFLAHRESLESKTSVQETNVFLQSITQVEQIKSTIIKSMWENYNQNLIEFAERMKGGDIQIWMQDIANGGAKSPNEYYAFILAQSSMNNVNGKNALIERFSQAFNEWVIDPNKEAHLSRDAIEIAEGYPTSAFIAGCMVCGVDIVREAIKNTSGIFHQQFQSNPVADVLFATALTTMLTPDYQSAAALIVALLNNGAIYKATEDALKKGKEKNIPPRDLDFAIKYAKQIIAIVSRKSVFSDSLAEEVKERDRLVRLMLTVMALNMLYRSGYGGMTGEEFAGILKGDTKDIHEKIKPYIEKLAELVKANLPDPQEAREDTILRLMDYVDTKDSIDSMLQSTRILANLLSTKDVDIKRWEVQSG